MRRMNLRTVHAEADTCDSKQNKPSKNAAQLGRACLANDFEHLLYGFKTNAAILVAVVLEKGLVFSACGHSILHENHGHIASRRASRKSCKKTREGRKGPSSS